MNLIFYDEYQDIILEKYNNLSERRKLEWVAGSSKLIGIQPMTVPTGEIFNSRKINNENESR